MTLQEFIDRTGINPSVEEFEKINDLYMAIPNLDKDTFCKDYKNHRFSVIISLLFGEHQRLQSVVDESHKAEIEVVRSLLTKFGDEVRPHCVKLIGEAQVVKIKLEGLMPLGEEDRTWLIYNARFN